MSLIEVLRAVAVSSAVMVLMIVISSSDGKSRRSLSGR